MSGPDSHGYLAGRGRADITGEIVECGLLGYGKAKQQATGLHTRLRSRAFVVVDAATGQRVLLSINDLPMVFDSVHREVLRRLANRFGATYNETNVMIAATHTHCGPGGYAHHRLYNSNTHGFRPATFDAIVDGIVEAAAAAHDDVAPARLTLAHGELQGASVNRSKVAFDLNPAEDRAHFPDAIDAQSTVLAFQRNDRLVGAINWFPTHCTSMTNANTLVSSDNKGYAAYHWERLVQGVDYLAPTADDFVGAFAQTNAGDMSPNLRHKPAGGPTDDEFENTRIIGERQYEAAAAALTAGARPVSGAVDSRTTYVDLARFEVQPEFTGDGRAHRTSLGYAGASAFAGTDEGPAFRGFHQGANPVWDAISNHVVYPLRPDLRDAQAPKGLLVPGGLINRIVPLAQERVPVQLFRIGPLYLIGLPGEATIVSGLRLRQTVANVVGAPLQDVLVAGYANAYIHYITTPEEYTAQRYEGGSTMFGRWELAALRQVVAGLATDLRDGRPTGRGDPPPKISQPRATRPRPVVDAPPPGRQLGEVVIGPRPIYRPGQQVRVVFAGVYPGNALRRGGTFIAVERLGADQWIRVADDGDWVTKLAWSWAGRSVSQVTVTWDIPPGAPVGRYRIAYHGDRRDDNGRLTPLSGVSEPFEVTDQP
jgi:neutral ceramidase